MLKKMIVFILFFHCFSLSASTITFDDLPPGYGNVPELSPYYENGVTIVGGGYFRTPGMLNISDSGTPFYPTLSFTANDLFTPVSFDLPKTYSNFYVVLSDPLNDGSIRYKHSYENVLVQGFRDGKLIADDRFDMDALPTYFFGSNFSSIDALSITAMMPSIEEEAPKINKFVLDNYPGNSIDYIAYYGFPTAHFYIDNVVLLDSNQLNPVPLPGSLPLFASVVGVFGFLTRRERKFALTRKPDERYR